MPPRLKPDAPDACYGEPQAPRAPYVSDDQPVYPPIPAQCPKCQGCIISQYGETNCINCGWVLQPLPLPQEPTMMKSGAVLPSVVEVGR